jgi:hypothetical protein
METPIVRERRGGWEAMENAAERSWCGKVVEYVV